MFLAAVATMAVAVAPATVSADDSVTDRVARRTYPSVFQA
jgi:hypothetical protein